MKRSDWKMFGQYENEMFSMEIQSLSLNVLWNILNGVCDKELNG